MERAGHRVGRTLALAQGGYYLATGLWPVLHLRSFEKLTGPKLEGWLVKTLGGLVSVVGGVMLLAGARRKLSPEVRLLGLGTAAAFGVADALYPLKGRISKVYLADAAPQLLLAAGWAWASRRLARARHDARAGAYSTLLLGDPS
jgi:hypothetical protein